MPINDLNSMASECDRVVNGMLDGTVSRDDGLFATAVTLKRITTELTQFVTYAAPILQTIHQAMVAAQAQAAAQAAQTAQAAQAGTTQAVAPAQAAQAPAPSLSVVPSSNENIQVVDATVRQRP